jgi:hypothetical protein
MKPCIQSESVLTKDHISIVETYKLEELVKEDILSFAKFASKFTEDPAHVNMWHDNWIDYSNTLPYLIFNSTRFANGNGQFFVLKIDGKIEAISGVHVSSFDPNVALGGVRSWISPEYRAKMLIGHHLLPAQLQWAKDNNLKTIALTFNDYNRRLINYFKRSALGVPKKRNATRLFYNGVNEVPFSINIQYTEQWAIYHKIDESYEPDWEKIKWFTETA